MINEHVLDAMDNQTICRRRGVPFFDFRRCAVADVAPDQGCASSRRNQISALRPQKSVRRWRQFQPTLAVKFAALFESIGDIADVILQIFLSDHLSLSLNF